MNYQAPFPTTLQESLLPAEYAAVLMKQPAGPNSRRRGR
jgi:hypothetical protein